MKVIVADTYDDMSRRGADIIAKLLQEQPTCVLGLATGTTPIGLYASLVQRYEAGDISFAGVTTFNLDEYCTLPPEHTQSYHYFMNEHLFNKVDINKENTHVPNGMNSDARSECIAYESAIDAAGGIDLQLLGIGANGHIGFNEPGDTFPNITHCVKLTRSTIEANSRLFNSIDEVPRQAYSAGIGTIMRARRILLLANGSGKSDTILRALLGPVTPELPASILQFHPNVTVILDKDAAQGYVNATQEYKDAVLDYLTCSTQ